MACELPEERGVPLGQWDCTEIARQLVDEGIVEGISAETVRRVLRHHQLRPWRWHAWLSRRVPRDLAFAQQVSSIIDLYTRRLSPDETVICLDEKTSLQPRKRLQPTRPARCGQTVQVEHEYERSGALNLFAAFDTRSGNVVGMTAARKRATEFLSFLEWLDAYTPQAIRTIHVVLDNLRVHKGTDEPTGNLDSHNAENVFNIFKELSHEQKLSLLVVTHDKEFAEKTDRIIEMGDGMIIRQ